MDNSAGRSARAKYERLRAREDRQRAARYPHPIRFVVLWGLGVAVLTVLAVVVLNAVLAQANKAPPPTGSAVKDQTAIPNPLAIELAAVLGLSSATTVLTKVWGRRQTTEAWGIGAD